MKTDTKINRKKESPELQPCSYTKPIYDREIKNIHLGKKTVFSINGVRKIGWLHAK